MNRFLHSLGVTLIHWRLAAQYEVQYRFNFVLQIIQSGVRLVTGVVAIRLVFGYTSDLGGWSEAELLAVLGIHILLGGALGTFVIPNMFTFMFQVREGELDYALVRPVDSQMFISTRQIRFWNVVDIATGAIVLGWAVADLTSSLSVLDVAWFVVGLLCGLTILYCVWMAFTTTSFWLINTDDMAQLLSGLYDAGRWPIRVYPLWLQGVLTLVVPMGIAITVPAEALTDRLSFGAMALLVAVTIVTTVLTRAFWLYGVRNYSGASA